MKIKIYIIKKYIIMEDILCWICYEENNNDNIISPCLCSGSMKYIHEECLKSWLLMSGNNSCPQCKYKYKIIVSNTIYVRLIQLSVILFSIYILYNLYFVDYFKCLEIFIISLILYSLSYITKYLIIKYNNGICYYDSFVIFSFIFIINSISYGSLAIYYTGCYIYKNYYYLINKINYKSTYIKNYQTF